MRQRLRKQFQEAVGFVGHVRTSGWNGGDARSSTIREPRLDKPQAACHGRPPSRAHAGAARSVAAKMPLSVRASPATMPVASIAVLPRCGSKGKSIPSVAQHRAASAQTRPRGEKSQAAQANTTQTSQHPWLVLLNIDRTSVKRELRARRWIVWGRKTVFALSSIKRQSRHAKSCGSIAVTRSAQDLRTFVESLPP